MRAVIIGFIVAAGTLVALLGVRGTLHSNRPLMLFSDMDVQPKYHEQGRSAFFADGRAMRTPPPGTVAFGGAEYFSDAGSPRQNPDLLQADDAFYRGQANGRWVARAPVARTGAVLDRGRDRFNIYCAVCHGAAGYGNGITTQYNLVGVANLHDERIRALPDGEIFNTITHGKGIMKPYGLQLRARDRWAVVTYVRALQRSQHARPADVPDAYRGELAP